MYNMLLIVYKFGLPGVCLCVRCHPIYSGRQTCGRTSRGHTGFLHFPSALLALIFIARMIQPFLSLVHREVEFCVLRAILNESDNFEIP